MSKRGRSWGQLLGEYAEVCELAQVLRDIADERQVTIRRLAQQMPYGHTKISQSLNGAARPEWAFVDAFLRACTAGDRQALIVLQQKVRPLWEAAAPERARPLAEIAVAAREQAITVIPPPCSHGCRRCTRPQTRSLSPRSSKPGSRSTRMLPEVFSTCWTRFG